nr:cellulase family glycosylhydrolase [Acuticoccus kalidii]
MPRPAAAFDIAEASLTTEVARVDARLREGWGTGGLVDLTLSARQSLSDWVVEIDVGGQIINLWNAEILDRSGTRYRVGAVDYNRELAAGTVSEFGFQAEGDGSVRVLSVTSNEGAVPAGPPPATPASPPAMNEAPPVAGIPAPPRVGAPPLDSLRQSTAPASPQAGDRTRLGQVSATPTPPAGPLAVDDVTVARTVGTRAGLPGATFAPGPFQTRGAAIVDASGTPAIINGVNWFGLETDIHAPHGLWARNWRTMMDDVKSQGFNLMRIPFSGELVRSGGGTPSGIDSALNPDLVGLDGLQILDAIVDYAGRIGLRILLDYHRGPAGDGPNDNGLWYGDGFTEADVIAIWQTMARRYSDAPAVIGADLVNEPHAGTWGDGAPTDWAAAAERIGNAVLAIAPQWLIVVEGIGTYEGDPYWWGGNLQGAADRPVRLSQPNRLVYSAHDYPPSVYPQPWFEDGSDLEDKFRQNWGYLVEEDRAPVFIGEWGSLFQTPADRAWADAIAAYMERLEIPWSWWALNPNSGDTGGLYNDDWTTWRRPIFTLLDPFLARTRPDIGFSDVAGKTNSADFVVRLDAPAQSETVLKYATTDGTAKAGLDYVASAGTLTFPPGAQEAIVSVPILPLDGAEGDRFFHLVIGGAGSTGSGTAVITGANAATTEPFVDVASTVIPDAGGTARFRVALSAAADRPVRIDFTLQGGEDGAATAASLTIPPGERNAVVEARLPARDAADGLVLTLTGADGAAVRNGQAVAHVAAARAEGGEIGLAPSSEAPPQLTIDIVMQDAWSDGALFNVVIRNISQTPVSAWELSIALPFTLTEIWNAELVERAGDRITLRNIDWNGTIGPNESINFGFISDRGNISLDRVLSEADVELAVQ